MIEAENFSCTGGWSIDQQFMDQMGSPYLLAHGLGKPVDDATTSLSLPEEGRWHVWVRTYNWTSPWFEGKGAGEFEVLVDGVSLGKSLGCKGKKWEWQYAGAFKVSSSAAVRIALHDLTGFDGRCDAIYLSRSKCNAPSDEAADVRALRERLVEGYAVATQGGEYDFVVCGGGLSGICAAVSAARKGLKVALIQDRPVLGGCNSSEIRVHVGGMIGIGPYPNLGNLLKEFGHAKVRNAGPAEGFCDDKKLAIVENEPNISLFLNTHVVDVEMDGDKIGAVLARDTRTGRALKFTAPLFADCTGDGCLGYLAGAEYMVGREGIHDYLEMGAPDQPDNMVMGASMLWYATERDQHIDFPRFEYGLKFSDESCYRVTFSNWAWETGHFKDQVEEAEQVRDYGMLAAYSNWSYLKNDLADNAEFDRYELDWMAYVAGKRESRRLVGDIVLGENDIMNNKFYEDGTCATSWTIDIHFPDPQNSKYFPGKEFKAMALHESTDFYPIPYRCFYSRNVGNLFMAGRDISVTHVALGGVRVMRTTAMMGEVVGLAAAVCHEHGSGSPRDVYSLYLEDLKEYMRQGAGKQGLHNNQRFSEGHVYVPRPYAEPAPVYYE